MTQPRQHATHPGIVKRLKRADGHSCHFINTIEGGQICIDTAGKRLLVHDHTDHCLGAGDESGVAEMKALAKLL